MTHDDTGGDDEPSRLRFVYSNYGVVAMIGAAIGIFLARYVDNEPDQG